MTKIMHTPASTIAPKTLLAKPSTVMREYINQATPPRVATVAIEAITFFMILLIGQASSIPTPGL